MDNKNTGQNNNALINNNGIEDDTLKEHSLGESIGRLCLTLVLIPLINFMLATLAGIKTPLFIFIIINIMFFWELVFDLFLIARDRKYNKLIREHKEIDYILLNEKLEIVFKIKQGILYAGIALTILIIFYRIFNYN